MLLQTRHGDTIAFLAISIKEIPFNSIKRKLNLEQKSRQRLKLRFHGRKIIFFLSTLWNVFGISTRPQK